MSLAPLQPLRCSYHDAAAPALTHSSSRRSAQPLAAPLARPRPCFRARLPPSRAQPEDDGQGSSADSDSPDAPAPPPFPPREPGEEEAPLSLADVNPFSLGRRSRAFVDDVWQRLLTLGAPPGAGGAALEMEMELAYRAAGEFAPEAAGTTVLVVGATGRIGKILVRKLSLRGYAVRALVRDVAAAAAQGCVLFLA